jgi:hypothetical protein
MPTTSTWWTLTLDDNPPVPVVDPTGGPGTRDITVTDWPFGPGPMPPTPRSYPAALERHDGPFVVERITAKHGRQASPSPTIRAPGSGSDSCQT